jgi:hypothetical protein
MGFTSDLLAGVAQLLDADGVAVWNPTGAYTNSEIGIVVGPPSQSPPSLVALMTYNNADDPAASDSSVFLQVRSRAPDDDFRKASDLDDAAFNSLQGLRSTVNGVRIVYGKRNSSMQLGVDGNGRQEMTSNYELMVHRPSSHRD